MAVVLGMRTVTRSVSLGSLQTKGSKRSISAQSDSDATESKRVYTLDRGKALDKKLQKCGVEHIIFEMKPGKNFVIRLSTAAYELAKSEIKNILRFPDLIGQYGIQTQIGLDCSDANTDTCLRMYNRRQNEAVGNIAKFTINFYHTTNTITVNGSRVDVFINNIFDKLCENIRSKHPQLDIANATIANQISSLKSVSKSKTVQAALDSTLSDNEPILQIEYQTRDDHQSDQTNIGDDSVIEELAFCPYCDQEVTVEGIYCIECESWLHYECVNLNPETVSNTFKDTEYVCDQCNEETLYGDSQLNTQDPVSEPGSNDVTSDRDTSPDSQATGVNKEWSIPSAMSDIGTSQKTSHSNSNPNPSPSKLHADPIALDENITVDKDSAPLEISSVGNSQITHIPRDNQVKSNVQLKEPPVRLNVMNPSQSQKPRRPFHKKPNKSDRSKSELSSPNDAAILLAQKTRILDLENEIKQLKNAFESVKISCFPRGSTIIQPN